jgi:hypothetical protein
VIHVVYMVDPIRGGWPTYAAHLMYGLMAANEPAQLWKIGGQVGRESPFGRGLMYKLNTVEFFEERAKAGDIVHIAAAHPDRAPLVQRMLDAGANITLHDPTELKGDMPAALSYARKPVVAVRPAIQNHLKISSRFVPHPYMRYPGDYNVEREQFAASFSRVDWDKGTHHIVAANLKLPADKQVQIYGFRHRPFVKHKLNVLDPDWERNYCGGDWPITDLWTGERYPADGLWSGVKLAKHFKFVLDMTAIHGDGGGTQYTFLEALDGGAPLVLNKAWHIDSYMDQVCSYVDAEGLAEGLLFLDQLGLSASTFEAADEMLAQHDAAFRAKETIYGS